MVQAGKCLAALSRLDPKAQPANLDSFFVQVYAVEVVFQNPFVEVEQGAVATEFVQSVVGPLILRVQLVKGFDEKSAAAASRVEQPNRGQLILPAFPKLNQCSPHWLGQLVELINAR